MIHIESFIQGYVERFERAYGFFRPYLRKVIYRYLDCGNLRSSNKRQSEVVKRGI